MKILFLTRSYYPNIGGVEKHIENIANSLVKKGHSVDIITEKLSTTYSNDYHSNYLSAKNVGHNKLRVFEIKAGKDNRFKKFRIWFELLKLYQLIKRADVVHAHDVYFWYFPFRILFPFKKSYVTFHGYEGNKLPDFKAKIMHKLSEALSDGNICVGKFLGKWYGTKATYVTYGASDFKNKTINKFTEKQNYKAIFIGRLEKETDILEYLKAINILKGKGIKITLDVYGSGSLLTEAKKTCQKNKLPVTFKGFIKEAADRLPDYEISFVSRYLGILESLSSAVPVYAIYNNLIKKDYLEMTPFSKYILIAGSGKDLADRVIHKNTITQEVIGKGYKWAKNETWDKLVNIYLSLWQREDKS